MKPLEKLLQELGGIGLAALALLALGAVFNVRALKPLEQYNARLDRMLDSVAAGRQGTGPGATPAAKLDAFYRFFQREDDNTDWLAKLYASAQQSKLELRSADYRLIDTHQRLSRYQITLPVTGSYVQIRWFLERSLAEIPILSLDHVAFHRTNTSDAAVEAEIVMTLHLLRQ